MDLRRYVRILTSRKAVIILTVEVALLVALLGTLRMRSVYTTSTLVRIAEGRNTAAVTFSDATYGARVMQTAIRLLTSRPFLTEVVTRLKLATRPEDLAGSIKIEAVPSTELIQIQVDNPDPRQAAAIANTLASVLIEQGQQLYAGGGRSPLDIMQDQLSSMDEQLRRDRAELAAPPSAQPGSADPGSTTARENLVAKVQSEERAYSDMLETYQTARLNAAMRAESVSVVEQAAIPTTPSKPRIALNVGLAAILGLTGGIGLAFLLENLNPAVHTADELQAVAALPLIGQVPYFTRRSGRRPRLVLRGDTVPHSPAAEAFRRVATSTLFLSSRNQRRVLLVSSATPQAGKSTVLSNLAIAMADAGRRVIAVDADLRNPSLHAAFDIPREPGLTDAVAEPERVHEVLLETDVPGLRVLPAGTLQIGPSETLSSPALGDLLRKLAGEADIVLWDSPPMLAVADAALLAPLVDGVLLVVAQDRISKREIERTLREFEQIGATMLGIVYNRVKGDDLEQYYTSYAAAGSRPSGTAQHRGKRS